MSAAPPSHPFNKPTDRLGAGHVDRYLGTSFDIVYDVYLQLHKFPLLQELALTLIPFMNQWEIDYADFNGKYDSVIEMKDAAAASAELSLAQALYAEASVTAAQGYATYAQLYAEQGNGIATRMIQAENSIIDLEVAVGELGEEKVDKQELLSFLGSSYVGFDSTLEYLEGTVGRGIKEADAVLRQDLADPTDPLKGAGQVGYRGRTVAAKLGDSLSVLDVGGAAEQHAIKDVTRVLCWGDSLTEGTGGTPYTSVLSASSSFNEILNRGVGGETSSQIKARFDAETTSHKNTVVIWAGRNNYTDPVAVLADIEGMVDQLGHSRFLVLSVLNGSYGGYEIPGGEGYALIESINNELMARYPLNYFDMRGWLISDGLADAGITPTAQDLTDIANDTPPTSLRSDAIHLNAAGYAVVGRKVLAELYKVFRPQSAYNSIGEILNVLSGETPTKWGYKAPIRDIVATLVRVGTSLSNSAMLSLSGDGNRLQSNKGLYPATHAALDLGALSTRWRNAYFSGSLSATTLAGAISTDFINLQNSVTLQVGTGSPESNTTAGVGSIFINRSGGAGTVLYVKESGTGNTGWVAK